MHEPTGMSTETDFKDVEKDDYLIADMFLQKSREPVDSDIEALRVGEVSNKLEDTNVLYDSENLPGKSQKLTTLLLSLGIETQGIAPIPLTRRTNPRIIQLFWVWLSSNFNILAFGTGSAGPAFFVLGLKDSLVIVLIMDIISCAFPAYFSIFGPKLGMRGMVQCRFSWGLYGGVIPSALNVISSLGFLVLNGIIGGQAIAAVSSKLDDTLGIVILGIISFLIAFCGYRVIHWFESYAWIPNAIVFPILLGLGGRHLNPSTFISVPRPSASSLISFTSFVASSVISWCPMTPDYGVYHDAQASERRIFMCSYLGFLIPSIIWHMLGAAFAAAAPGVPAWKTGFEEGNNVGGLVVAILAPAKGFGKFLTVLIALSTSATCAPTMYTFGLSAMAVAPVFARVPRYILIIISVAIYIPLAIIGAKIFYSTLVDVLSVIGYWATLFAVIVLTEHFVFRKRFWTAYDVTQWNKPAGLPPGIAAILAFVCGFGIIVPSMKQTWYTGPIARAGTGDIGIVTGGVVTLLVYIPLRAIERKIWPGR